MGAKRIAAVLFGIAAVCLPASAADPRTFLDNYCVRCHTQFSKADLSNIPADAELWEKAIKKLRAGAMPPVGQSASLKGRCG